MKNVQILNAIINKDVLAGFVLSVEKVKTTEKTSVGTVKYDNLGI